MILTINLEVSTRVKFYEVQKIFQKLENPNLEDVKLWLELLVYRLSEIFQNCINAYDYLDKKDLRKSLIENMDTLQIIKKYRENMFHNSRTILDKTIDSNFFQMTGEYFKGLHVKIGGYLEVGENRFKADHSEFVFTTEGIFEIKNPYTKDEIWEKLEYPSIITSNYDKIIGELRSSLIILQNEFFKIMKILREGKKEDTFIQMGTMVFFEGNKAFDLNGKHLDVYGALKIDPMDSSIDLKSKKIMRS